MTQTVTALYDTYDSAVSAVNALEASGVPHSDISIVSNNVDNRHSKDRPTNAAEDAGKGAGIGAAVGGVGGLLTGLGLLAIPGVGPVVAAGWLVATAAGAATGAVVGGAAGGLVGALTGAGVRLPRFRGRLLAWVITAPLASSPHKQSARDSRGRSAAGPGCTSPR